jgi:HEAT repeat protein
MPEYLTNYALPIGLLLGGILLYVPARELRWHLKRKKEDKQKKECFDLIGNVENISEEDLLPLALDIKKDYNIGIAESVLQEFRDKAIENDNETLRSHLAKVYLHLDIIDHYIEKLTDKDWEERSFAADELGQIGHAKAVTPLINLIKDLQEDPDVKNIALRSLGRIHDKEALDDLTNALGTSQSSVDHQLIDTILSFKEDSIPFLVNILTSENSTKRFLATKTLSQIKNSQVIPHLLSVLSDHEARVRAEAALGLGRLKSKESTNSLVNLLLFDPVLMVREAAAESIGEIADEQTLHSLQIRMEEFDTTVQKQIMQAMEKIGESSQSIFVNLLNSKNADISYQAALALERIGFVSAEIQNLSQSDWKEAYYNLSKISQSGVIETLITNLDHPDMMTRIRICRLLAQSKNPRFEDGLKNVVRHDKEWAVRLEALKTLLKTTQTQHIDIVEESLKSDEVIFKEELLKVLSNLPSSFSSPLEPKIKNLLQDSNQNIRAEAINLLKVISREGTNSECFITALSDSSPSVRINAIRVFSNSAYMKAVTEKDQLYNILVHTLDDTSKRVRMAAIEALSTMNKPEVIKKFIQCFEWTNEFETEMVAQSIAKLCTENTIDYVDEIMAVNTVSTRVGVTTTLGYIAEKKCEKLILLFLSDKEPLIRQAAVRSLQNYLQKQKEFENLDDFLPFLQDPSVDVRKSLIRSLAWTDYREIIPHLISLISQESNKEVYQDLILTISVLASQQEDDVKLVEKSLAAIDFWVTAKKLGLQKSFLLLARALLHDHKSYRKILMVLCDKNMMSELKNRLLRLPFSVQDIVFTELSITPEVFFSGEQNVVFHHYDDLLNNSLSAEKRSCAIWALQGLKTEESIDEIYQSFNEDPLPEVRSEALMALSDIDKPALLARVVQMAATDPSEIVRKTLSSLLYRLDANSLQSERHEIMKLMETQFDYIRKPASRLLSELYKDDWKNLVDTLMESTTESKILGLLHVLANLNIPDLADVFLTFFQHKNSHIKSLCMAYAAETDVVPSSSWFDFINDPLEEARLATVKRLTFTLNEETLALLNTKVQDPSQKIRKSLALWLGVRPCPDDQINARNLILSKLAQDYEYHVKLTALISLAIQGQTPVAHQVKMTIEKISKEERRQLVDELQAEGTLEDLNFTLQNSSDAVKRQEALLIISLLGAERFLNMLLPATQDPSQVVRMSAFEAIKNIDNPLVKKACESLLQDPIGEIRDTAKHTLQN